MKNLFKEKKWDAKNLRLIFGDLYACMNGQQWVLLWEDVDNYSFALKDTNILIYRGNDTFSMYIEDGENKVKVFHNYKYLTNLSYDDLIEVTYSKYYNSDAGTVAQVKNIAMMLNAATRVKHLCPEDDIFSLNNGLALLNTCIYDEIFFINVSGKKWYPVFNETACTYDRNDGIGIVNNLAFPTRVIIPNKKHRTLDVFRILGDGDLDHVAVYDKEHLKKKAESMYDMPGWKMIHYLFLAELNRDVNETTLYADDKPYMTLDGDDWGEPEKEETVYIKEYEDGIEAKVQVKEGFTGLWNKIRKDILGVKTPSERFEEEFGKCTEKDTESVKKFRENLANALNVHVNKELLKDKEEKPKTLNDIRKEHGFEETVAREATDDEPLSLREMAQPLLDELRDAERYAWNKYIDDFEAKWNHDMLKAHLNEKLVNDNVNAPDHYKLRGLDIEAIDVIRGALTEDEFRGFCKGNVLKYTIREGHKNGDEDLKKAKKYLDFLEKDE